MRPSFAVAFLFGRCGASVPITPGIFRDIANTILSEGDCVGCRCRGNIVRNNAQPRGVQPRGRSFDEKAIQLWEDAISMKEMRFLDFEVLQRKKEYSDTSLFYQIGDPEMGVPPRPEFRDASPRLSFVSAIQEDLGESKILLWSKLIDKIAKQMCSANGYIERNRPWGIALGDGFSRRNVPDLYREIPGIDYKREREDSFEALPMEQFIDDVHPVMYLALTHILTSLDEIRSLPQVCRVDDLKKCLRVELNVPLPGDVRQKLEQHIRFLPPKS